MDSAKLTPYSSGFVLAAAITVLFNTALACAKDSYAPLKTFMKSLQVMIGPPRVCSICYFLPGWD